MNTFRHTTAAAILIFSIAILTNRQQAAAALDPAFIRLKELTSSPMGGVNKNTPPATMDLIDNSINPDSYKVGGGDVFSIHILQLPSVEYSAIMDQNCDAVISELGVVRIGKKTLTETKKIITDFVTKRLKSNYDVYVALTRVKTAVVTIAGSISNPGTYQVEGTYRLFDVIRLSNNHTTPNLSEYDFREVKVIRDDTIAAYDLYKFLYCNDNSQNPYVYPGDNINISLAGKRVYVSGCVRNLPTGYVPFKPNETVKDFLALFTLDGAADSNAIIITKHNEDGSSRSITYSMQHPQDILLADRDIVIVPSRTNYPRVETATISGEVLRPGTYAINRRVTTAPDLIGLAGGPTIYANVKRAYIIRKGKQALVQKSLNPPVSTNPQQSQGRPVAPASLRPEVATALNEMISSNDFSIIALRDENKNAILEPTDEVVVPKVENMVFVSGSVKAPGAYPLSEGKTAAYYIQCAGGKTAKADKTNIFVMAQYLEQYQIKGVQTVEDGDVVVVPESQQYKQLSTLIFPIIGVFLSALSTLLVLYSVVHK